MTSKTRGYGRQFGAIGSTSDLLIGRGDIFPTEPPPAVVADWFFPPGPPTPVEVPYTWLSPPLVGRPDDPITTAEVSQDGGITASRVDDLSVAEYGDNPFSATLFTASEPDAANLAQFMLDFYATQPGDVPRTRFPALLLNLSARTAPEKWRLLGLTEGTRITVTDTPTGWPAGATEQVVEGIHHRAEKNVRWLELNTSPVIGTEAGTAGPWFRLGASFLGSDDYLLP